MMFMAKGVSELLDLEVAEVSAVDRPANAGCKVLLVKGAGDPLDAVLASARSVIAKGELAEIVSQARAGMRLPASVLRAALDELARQVGASVPPNMRLVVAMQTADGAALMAALARATQ